MEPEYTINQDHVQLSSSRPLIKGAVGVLAPGEVHGFADCTDLNVTNVYNCGLTLGSVKG